MTGKLGKVVSSGHKEMFHNLNLLWFTSTCLNICFLEHSTLYVIGNTLHCETTNKNSAFDLF